MQKLFYDYGKYYGRSYFIDLLEYYEKRRQEDYMNKEAWDHRLYEDAVALAKLLELKDPMFAKSLYQGVEIYSLNRPFITYVGDFAYTYDAKGLPGNWHFAGDYYILDLA